MLVTINGTVENRSVIKGGLATTGVAVGAIVLARLVVDGL